MTLREYLQALRSWLLLAGLALGLLCAAAFTLLATPRYAANITFFVSAQGLQNDASRAYQGSLLSAEKVKTYTELIMSDRIRAQVGNRLDAEVASGQIIASPQPQTVLITATITDVSPDRARQIADAVGVEFVALVAQLEKPEDNLRGAPTVIAQVVQPAQLPAEPISPRPVWNLMVGAFVGLLLGYGIALLRHLLILSPSGAQFPHTAGSGPLTSLAPDPQGR